MRISDWSSDGCSSDLVFGTQWIGFGLCLWSQPASFQHARVLHPRGQTNDTRPHHHLALVLSNRLWPACGPLFFVLRLHHAHLCDFYPVIGKPWYDKRLPILEDSIRVPITRKIGRASCRERVVQYV